MAQILVCEGADYEVEGFLEEWNEGILSLARAFLLFKCHLVL